MPPMHALSCRVAPQCGARCACPTAAWLALLPFRFDGSRFLIPCTHTQGDTAVRREVRLPNGGVLVVDSLDLALLLDGVRAFLGSAFQVRRLLRLHPLALAACWVAHTGGVLVVDALDLAELLAVSGRSWGWPVRVCCLETLNWL